MKPSAAIITHVHVCGRQVVKRLMLVTLHREQSTKPHVARAICALLLLVMPVHDSLATSIVIIRTWTDIVVSADSGQLLMKGDGTNSFRRTCKIGQDGRVFFAIAGVVTGPNGYDAMKIASDACQITKGTLLDKLRAFEKLIATPFSESVKEKARTQARKEATDGLTITDDLEVAFFGFEQGTAQVHVRIWIVGRSGDTVVVAPGKGYDCPGEGCRTGGSHTARQFVPMGVSELVHSHTSDHPEDLLRVEPAKYAPLLVGLELDAHKDLLMGPITTLRITDRAAMWVGDKGECSEVASYPAPEREQRTGRGRAVKRKAR